MVRTIFSTSAVHPRDRFDYWHEVACTTIVDHDFRPERRLGFHAELQFGTLASIGCILFENSPMTIQHTARQIGHAGSDELFVCRQMAATLALQQDGRTVVLEPGDIALIDPLRPYSGQFFPGSKSMVLKIQRRPLEARVGKTHEMTACAVRRTSHEGALTSAFLAMLPDYVAGISVTADEIIGNQMIDLVAFALAKATAGQAARTSFARSLVLMKLRTAIETRLTDPALDVASVVAASGISRRYASAVLAAEGTSIMQLIRTRRLEHCRQALADPSQAHRKVSEIAYAWGFADMTHFDRTFRAAYAMSPGAYRKRSTATLTAEPGGIAGTLAQGR